MRSGLSQAEGSWTSAGEGRVERPEFMFAESLPVPFGTRVATSPLPPSQHLSNASRPSLQENPSSMVLSETLRIVSKLTHTTNVREPCHTALGSASCCLRCRCHCRPPTRALQRVHPGPLLGRGQGGAGAGPAPLALRPRPSFPPPRTAMI